MDGNTALLAILAEERQRRAQVEAALAQAQQQIAELRAQLAALVEPEPTSEPPA